VMPSLADVAGNYTLQLFGVNPTTHTFIVVLIGIAWIVLMTWICYIGIELSAATQRWLLTLEFITLIVFAVVALIKVYVNHPAHSVEPQASWFNPFDVSSLGALNGGILLAIFIYWGWDSGVSVNEETEDPSSSPGKSAVISTFILVTISLLGATETELCHCLEKRTHTSAHVFAPLGHKVRGSRRDRRFILAVL